MDNNTENKLATVWAAVTVEDGELLSVFESAQSALDYYGVEVTRNGATGLSVFLGLDDSLEGVTFACQQMSSDEIDAVFGEDREYTLEPRFSDQRWSIYLWNSVDAVHQRILLRQMPVISYSY